MRDHDNGGTPSNPQTIIPKSEVFDFHFPSDVFDSTDNAASSSASSVRSFFTGMGFLPSLVDKVIQDHGEDNVDLLLEILVESSDPHKSNAQSSDSLHTLFHDNDSNKPPEYSTFIQPKEEPDEFGFDDGKRALLLQMNFLAEEVDFAMEKLGMDAPVDEIVDFITAAQVATNNVEEIDHKHEHHAEQNEDICNEILFGTMEKTLQLLEMGFSESEVSLAIERFGSEVPVLELANSICAEQVGEKYVINHKYSSKLSGMNSNMGIDQRINLRCSKKPENFGREARSRSSNWNLEEIHRGKRPKQEYNEGYSNAENAHFGFEENYEEEEPKPDYTVNSSFSFEPTWVDEKIDTELPGFRTPKAPKFNACKSVDRMVAKPPYFFYGNVDTISLDTWGKISQFLYGVEPEFVETRFFSTLSRKEGYVHNLPFENRFHILPKPPMSIEDTIPQTKKWWPSWDTRKQLSFISFETNGVSQLCDQLGRILADSRGLISNQQKREILHHCHKLNLIWVGVNKVRPMEPEQLELILGYPLNHTKTCEGGLPERLHALRYSFQIDTLAYHLSVLKSVFLRGITMLSLFSGIGGAEVALHRLGIHMKGVVSVETCERKRKILRMWWQNSGQTGELEQIEDIQKLTTSKVDGLIEKFGGFDLIICQSPCTCSSDNPRVVVGQQGNSPSAFDFSKFCEFVRVLQRVRNLMQRKR